MKEDKQQAVDEEELARVWAIAEKHRREAVLWRTKYEAVNNSILWKITYPLRSPGKLRDLFLFLYHLIVSRLKNRLNNAFFRNNFTKKHNAFIQARRRLPSADKVGVDTQSAKVIEGIAVSVVTYNNLSYFNRFINTLCDSYDPSKVNLLIRDNGSKDSEQAILDDVLENYGAAFKTVRVEKGSNVGFGHGHDLNIRKCSDDLILVSNVDLEFKAQTIKELLTAVTSSSENVACWEARQSPFEHPKYYDPFTMTTHWCSHACVLIDRRKYIRVGGYDKNIFMYGEDVELSFRFRKYGYELRYVPTAVVFHDTYEDANTFKPLMFSGSLFASVYIRLKYGTFLEAVAGMTQLKALRIKEAGERKSLVTKAESKISRASVFKTIFRTNNLFMFDGFDYDIKREGAFVPVNICDNEELCSIIVRTYRGREYLLNEALTSIFNQTYKNLEVLVCVDGGEELDSPYLAMIGQRRNVKVYRLPKKGRSFAGNFGLKKARGKYVCFLDDDDGLFSDHVECLYAAIRKSEGCRAAYSLAFEVPTDIEKNDDEIVTGYEEYDVKTNPYFFQTFDRERLLTENYFPIQSVLFEKSVFNDVGGFNESFEYLEDWNLWFKYATVTDFKYVEKTTSFFRVPNKINTQVKRQRLLDEAYQVVKKENLKFYLTYKA